jgi:hypothetical protein
VDVRRAVGLDPDEFFEPPIGLGAEERVVDTKVVEIVVEQGNQLV